MTGQDLHRLAVVCDCHQEMLDSYVYEFLVNEEKAVTGEIHIFDEVYLPILQHQGVNVVNMAVGGGSYRPGDVLRIRTPLLGCP